MDPNTIVVIEKGLEAALALGPLAVEAAMKIKHLLELDPSFQVNLKNLTDEAIAIDQDTIDAIEAWKATLPVVNVAKPPQPLTPTPPSLTPESHLADSIDHP